MNAQQRLRHPLYIIYTHITVTLHDHPRTCIRDTWANAKVKAAKWPCMRIIRIYQGPGSAVDGRGGDAQQHGDATLWPRRRGVATKVRYPGETQEDRVPGGARRREESAGEVTYAPWCGEGWWGQVQEQGEAVAEDREEAGPADGQRQVRTVPGDVLDYCQEIRCALCEYIRGRKRAIFGFLVCFIVQITAENCRNICIHWEKKIFTLKIDFFNYQILMSFVSKYIFLNS